MSENIPPPQPTLQSQLQTQQQPQVQVQQQQQLFKLPVGAQFNAAVVGGDKNGNPIIKLGGNDLLLSSPIALAKGAQLALKVDGASGSISLQLLSVDGKLPPTQAQANSNNLQNPPPQGQNQQLPILKLLNIAPSNSPAAQAFAANNTPVQNAQTAAQAQAVVVGSSGNTNATGVVINPIAEALQGARAQIKAQLPTEQATKILQNLPNNVRQGTEINFKITNIQQTATQPNIASAQGAAPNQQIGTDNQVLKGQEFHNQPQQGSQNTQNPQSQTKPSFTPQLQTAPDGTIKVTAQVVSNNSSGQVVVDTALGKISLNTPLATNKIQPGAILNLEIANITQAKPEAIVERQNPLQALANDWPALRDLANALNNANQPNALNRLAGLDSIFAARLANYFSSVQNGNLNNWLSGELMNVLDESTREQLLARLRGDFANIQRLANDSGSSWQTFLFPIFDGEELRQAKFHLKYLEDENGKQDKENGARFVVEFHGGTFGEMQLDGLVRTKLARNQFDLIVRSHDPIETEVQNDIREIFSNAQEVAGFNGSIDFSIMNDFPERPLDEKLSRLMHSDDSIKA